MKKFLWMGVLVAGVLAAAAFVGVLYVKAQAPTPGTPGLNGGRGWMMGGSQPMAEYMHAAIAEKLGLSEQEFEDQLAQGKTAWQIAEDKGLSQEAFTSLMADARNAALQKMVADGVITQEQADWMKTRAGTMMGRGQGYGMGQGGCPMFDGDSSSNPTPGGQGRGRGGRGMMGGNY